MAGSDVSFLVYIRIAKRVSERCSTVPFAPLPLDNTRRGKPIVSMEKPPVSNGKRKRQLKATFRDWNKRFRVEKSTECCFKIIKSTSFLLDAFFLCYQTGHFWTSDFYIIVPGHIIIRCILDFLINLSWVAENKKGALKQMRFYNYFFYIFQSITTMIDHNLNLILKKNFLKKFDTSNKYGQGL